MFRWSRTYLRCSRNTPGWHFHLIEFRISWLRLTKGDDLRFAKLLLLLPVMRSIGLESPGPLFCSEATIADNFRWKLSVFSKAGWAIWAFWGRLCEKQDFKLPITFFHSTQSRHFYQKKLDAGYYPLKANYVWSHTQCCSKSSFWDSGLTIANDFRMMHEQTTWSSSSSSSSLSPTTATSSSPPSTAADEQHQQHVHSSGYGQYGENVQVKSEQEWFKDILNKLLAC